MSFLRQQVQALREERSGSNALLQRRKGRASLLLSPDDAADVDLGTVREAAVSGLQSLAALDERFAAFETTLFSREAQAMPRDLLTPEGNARIDESIAAFLRLVSPHFLLRPAHLTLEYLVRHYAIHRENADELMRCLLPWHDTRLFARAVQLMMLRGTRWEFLRPVQQTGTPLPRAALTRRLADDNALLQLICDIVREAAGPPLPAAAGKQRKATTTASPPTSASASFPHLYSFFAAAAVEALDHGTGLQEASVRTLVPTLLEGISSARSPDFQLACYLVTARLATKGAVSEALTDAILRAVASGRCAAGAEPPLLCALAVAQGQGAALTTLSPAAFEGIAKMEGMPGALAGLSLSYDVLPLAKLLALGFVSRLSEGPESALGLGALLGDAAWPSEAPLPRVLASAAAAGALAQCERALALPNGDDGVERAVFLDGCRAAMSTLWQRFPDETGAAMEITMRALQAAGELPRAEALFSLLEGSMSGGGAGRGLMGPEDGGGSLLLALEHPSPAMRVQALARARKVISRSGNGRETVGNGLGPVLVRRLADDDAGVVTVLLASKKLAGAIAAVQFPHDTNAVRGEIAAGSASTMPATALAAVSRWRSALRAPAAVAAPYPDVTAALSALLKFLSGPLLAARPDCLCVVLPALLACFPGAEMAAVASRGEKGQKAVRQARRAAVRSVCEAAVVAAVATGHPLLANLPVVPPAEDGDDTAAATAVAAAEAAGAAGEEDANTAKKKRKQGPDLDTWGKAVVRTMGSNLAQCYGTLDLEELLGDSTEEASRRVLLEAAVAALADDSAARLSPADRSSLAERTVSLLLREVRRGAGKASWVMRCIAAAVPALPVPTRRASVVWCDHLTKQQGEGSAGSLLEVLLLCAAGRRATVLPAAAGEEATAAAKDGDDTAASAAAAEKASVVPALEALSALLQHHYGMRPLPALAALSLACDTPATPTGNGSDAALQKSSEVAGVQALCIAATLVTAAAEAPRDNSSEAVAADVVATLPCMLLCLGKPHQEVRRAAILYLTAVTKYAAARQKAGAPGGQLPTPATPASKSARKAAKTPKPEAEAAAEAAAADSGLVAAALEAALPPPSAAPGGAASKPEEIPLLDLAAAAVLLRAVMNGREKELALDADCFANCLAAALTQGAAGTAAVPFLLGYACRLADSCPGPAAVLLDAARGCSLQMLWAPAARLLRRCLAAAGGGPPEDSTDGGQGGVVKLAVVLMEMLGFGAASGGSSAGSKRADWGEFAGDMFGLLKLACQSSLRPLRSAALRLLAASPSEESGVSRWCLDVLTDVERCELLTVLVDLLRLEDGAVGDASLASEAVAALPVDPAVAAALLADVLAARPASSGRIAAAGAEASSSATPSKPRGKRKLSLSLPTEPLPLNEACRQATAAGAAVLVEKTGGWLAALTAVTELLFRKGVRGYATAGSGGGSGGDEGGASWALVSPLFSCLRELQNDAGSGGGGGAGFDQDSAGAVAYCQGLLLDVLTTVMAQPVRLTHASARKSSSGSIDETQPRRARRGESIDSTNDVAAGGTTSGSVTPGQRRGKRAASIESAEAAGGSPTRRGRQRVGSMEDAAAAGGAAAYPAVRVADDAAVVLECLKRSERPQTRNSALRLVAAMAQSFPRELALCLLPLLREVGAGSAGGYSFQVAQAAVQAILRSLRDHGGAVGVTAGDVAAVFAAALDGMPTHHRSPMFKLVLRCLGSEVLAAVLAALLARAAAGGSSDGGSGGGRGSSSGGSGSSRAERSAAAASMDAEEGEKHALVVALAEFGHQVCGMCGAEEQLAAMLQLVYAAHRLAVAEIAGGDATLASAAAAGGEDAEAAVAEAVEDFQRHWGEGRLQELRKRRALGRGGPSLLALPLPKPAQESSSASTSASADAFYVVDLSALLSIGAAETGGGERPLPLAAMERLLLEFVRDQLSSPVLRRLSSTAAPRSGRGANDGTAARVQRGFLLLCEALLLLLHTAADVPHAAAGRSGKNHMAYEVLDALQSLLVVPDFVALVQVLLHHENPRLRRKALQMLNARMEASEAGGRFTDEESNLFLEMLPSLRSVIAAGASPPPVGEIDDTGAAVGLQSALLAVDALVRPLGARHPERFLGVLDDVAALVASLPLPGSGHSSGSGGEHLANSAFLGLATLTAKLGPRALSKLPVFFPAVLSALEWCGRTNNDSGTNSGDGRGSGGSGASSPGAVRLLRASALSATATVAGSLPQFLSPYLRRLLVAVVQPVLSSDAHVAGNADCVLRLLARGVPLRALLPAVVEARGDCAAEHGPGAAEALGALFSFAGEAVGDMSRSDAPAHLARLSQFICDGLDYRRSIAAAATAAGPAEALASAEDVAAVEEKVTSALVALVLRLSEEELDSLFLRLCEWKSALAHDALAAAAAGAGIIDGLTLRRDIPSVDRYIAFFAAVERLAATLRPIFVPYFDRIMDDCCAAIEAAGGAAASGEIEPPRAKRKKANKGAAAAAAGAAGAAPVLDAERSMLLLRRVLLSLQHCFRFDADSFVDAARFGKLMPPLVALLEAPTPLSTGDSAYLTFAEEALAPCIGQLAFAAGKDVFWKPLLHAVLLQSRNERARVREAAICVAESCFAAVGEDLLGLLPECLSFISEGLEDEDAGVSAACRRLVRLVEASLGESLESYLA